MPIQITSSTQSEAEMQQAMELAGGRALPPETAKTEPAPPPAAPAASASEPPAQPGELPSAEAEGGIAPASEAGDKTTQEEPPPAKPEDPNHPNRGNFESRRKRLERENAKLREGKTSVEQQLADALSKLAELQPAQAAEPAKAEGPERPKRPTLADCDFDQERYESEMSTYDDSLGEYHKALALKAVKDQQEADRQAKAKADQEAAAKKTFDEFVERKEAGRSDYQDWDEIFGEDGALGEEGIELAPAMEASIMRSDVPADLLYFFGRDAVENGGKELARIVQLDPVSQVRAMTLLEHKLAGDREARKAKPAAPAVAAPAAPKAEARPPAAPKPRAVPEAPIEPVGSRAPAVGPTLAAAKTPQEYFKLRQQGVTR